MLRGPLFPQLNKPMPYFPAPRLMRLASHPAPKPLSMLTTPTPGRAGVEHGQQRGQTAEAGPVTHAGGHRDNRHVDKPPDDARQRPFHSGSHHDGPGGAQPFGLALKSRWMPETPDVIDAVHLSLPSISAVTAASSDTGMSAVPAETIQMGRSRLC